MPTYEFRFGLQVGQAQNHAKWRKVTAQDLEDARRYARERACVEYDRFGDRLPTRESFAKAAGGNVTETGLDEMFERERDRWIFFEARCCEESACAR